MISIAALSWHVGEPVEGIYTLHEPQWRMTRYGLPFFAATLQDATGAIAGYDWSPDGGMRELAPGQSCVCRLRPRRLRHQLVADLMSCRPATGALPLSGGPILRPPPAQLMTLLRVFVKDCPVPALKHFLRDVFADEAIRTAFLSLPASLNHHHAWPGGLAAHSLEVATITRHTLTGLGEDEHWLAATAGLLHDIGKIRTLRGDGRRTQLGFVVRHEALAVEILAPALKTLDQAWPDGGIALRYLLTWRQTRTGAPPLLPGAVALDCADRISSAQAVRDDLFRGRPDWQRFARHEGHGPPSTFWRPRLP